MSLLRLTIVLLVVGLVVSGCGRRGPLEPPPGKIASDPLDRNQPDDPNADRPFVLDPLI